MILKHKKINVLGTMSGTSFDGVDISTISPMELIFMIMEKFLF